MRSIALDIHQSFCEVAIREHAQTRSAARVATDRAERQLSDRAEVAYRRLVADWRASGGERGAGATPGRASSRPSKRQAARQASAPGPAL